MNLGNCAVCGIEVRILKNGTTFKHGKQRTSDGKLEGKNCPGSGRPPKPSCPPQNP